MISFKVAFSWVYEKYLVLFICFYYEVSNPFFLSNIVPYPSHVHLFSTTGHELEISKPPPLTVFFKDSLALEVCDCHESFLLPKYSKWNVAAILNQVWPTQTTLKIPDILLWPFSPEGRKNLQLEYYRKNLKRFLKYPHFWLTSRKRFTLSHSSM